MDQALLIVSGLGAKLFPGALALSPCFVVSLRTDQRGYAKFRPRQQLCVKGRAHAGSGASSGREAPSSSGARLLGSSGIREGIDLCSVWPTSASGISYTVQYWYCRALSGVS